MWYKPENCDDSEESAICRKEESQIEDQLDFKTKCLIHTRKSVYIPC